MKQNGIFSPQSITLAQVSLSIILSRFYLILYQGLFLGELSCSLNSERNLIAILETLSPTAIHEPFLWHSFTSTTIVTKQSFRFDKIEPGSKLVIQIRASLPSTTILQTQLLLIPYNFQEYRSYYIMILRNHKNTTKMGFLTSFEYSEKCSINNTMLVEFNDYELEINHDKFIWKINREQHSIIPRTNFRFVKEYRINIQDYKFCLFWKP